MDTLAVLLYTSHISLFDGWIGTQLIIPHCMIEDRRYHYPEFDTTQTWAKVPSQELSDALVEMFQDKLKPDK